MDVSDRRMQVQLTQEAKIVSDFFIYQSDFCGCGLCQRSDRDARMMGVPVLFVRAASLLELHARGDGQRVGIGHDQLVALLHGDVDGVSLRGEVELIEL